MNENIIKQLHIIEKSASDAIINEDQQLFEYHKGNLVGFGTICNISGLLDETNYIIRMCKEYPFNYQFKDSNLSV